jgi:dihydrofolate reductase
MSAELVYSFSVSLDGYINTPTGSLDWVDIDQEVHSWFNDRARDATGFVYGRRLYEVMAAYWPTAGSHPDTSPVEVEFAEIWNARPKIVFSRTLEHAEHADRLLRTDIVDEIAGLKSEFDGLLDVGGATLASPLIERNLIDRYEIVVHPVVLGGGTPFFPAGATLDLRLVETRTFDKGAVLLSYRPTDRR